jgi:hypothetical protein
MQELTTEERRKRRKDEKKEQQIRKKDRRSRTELNGGCFADPAQQEEAILCFIPMNSSPAG